MVDRTGNRYGKLLVLGWEKNTIDARGQIIPWWKCQCDCGNTRIVRGDNLQQGTAKDCGCGHLISDLTGNKYGKLTVKKMFMNKRKPYYECVCDCGESVNVCRYDLINNKRTCCESCKVITRPNKVKDITGQRFGRLLVLRKDLNVYYTTGGKRKSKWICQCDCGEIVSVTGNSLKRGSTTSCGCYQAEKLGMSIDDYRKSFNATTRGNGLSQDFTGQRFGKLVVREKVGNSKNGKTKWVCDCDCGGTTIVVGNNLKNGHTQSCGCIDSVGESKISMLLDSKGIEYCKEKTYSDCKDKHPLPFDFGIKKNNKVVALVEYDGLQHFQPVRFNGMTKERALSSFEDCVKHDQMKDEYCFINNIPLLRIRYDEVDNLENILDTFLKEVI